MSLSNYDIVYACSELFSIYIIYYFFQSLFVTTDTINSTANPKTIYSNIEIGIFLSRMVIFWIVLLLGYFL